MPRVIQPGGGGGKMRVRYTACRKRGLVAASKRMQAEGMTLRAAASELHVTPPPRQKNIENEAATPSPGRFSPNPIILRLIVMLSALATGWSVRFRPPGQKMKGSQPPPPTNIVEFPLERQAAVPSPVYPSPHPGAH
jgi:hypothetical protein